VYVPAGTARDVYVLGAVTQPRPVAYTEGMTVAAAIASAYGTLRDAYTPQVAVVRGSFSQPEITIVNYRKVIRGEDTDIVLQPRDIVYVPLSPYRYLRRYAEINFEYVCDLHGDQRGSYAVTKQQVWARAFSFRSAAGFKLFRRFRRRLRRVDWKKRRRGCFQTKCEIHQPE